MSRFFNNQSENLEGGYDDEGFDGNDMAGGPGEEFDNFGWGNNTNSPAGPFPYK